MRSFKDFLNEFQQERPPRDTINIDINPPKPPVPDEDDDGGDGGFTLELNETQLSFLKFYADYLKLSPNDALYHLLNYILQDYNMPKEEMRMTVPVLHTETQKPIEGLAVSGKHYVGIKNFYKTLSIENPLGQFLTSDEPSLRKARANWRNRNK